jgi:hypothetical protein
MYFCVVYTIETVFLSPLAFALSLVSSSSSSLLLGPLSRLLRWGNLSRGFFSLRRIIRFSILEPK